jgi:uncharacterized protein YpmS
MSKFKIWNQSFISLIAFNTLSDTDFALDVEGFGKVGDVNAC